MIESDLIKIEAIQIVEAFNIKKIRTEFEVETILAPYKFGVIF